MIRSCSDFYILIRSRDIRDQSSKLSKIAKNSGRFFGRHKFFGVGIVIIISILNGGCVDAWLSIV